MRNSIVAGITAGVVLGVGGAIGIGVASSGADASSDGQSLNQAVTRADLNAANERSISAIRRATNLQNALGKFFTPNGVRIGTTQPPGVIRQDAGTGQNGLPTGTILNGAITNPKLANEAVNSEKIAPGGVTSGDLADNSVTESKLDAGAVTSAKVAAGAIGTPEIGNGAVTQAKLAEELANKLPKSITKTDNGANTNGRVSSPAYSIVRFAAGNYRADFGDTDISACWWNAVPSTDAGLPDGFEVRTALSAADPTRVVVRTYTSGGALVESGWQAQVFC